MRRLSALGRPPLWSQYPHSSYSSYICKLFLKYNSSRQTIVLRIFAPPLDIFAIKPLLLSDCRGFDGKITPFLVDYVNEEVGHLSITSVSMQTIRSFRCSQKLPGQKFGKRWQVLHGREVLIFSLFSVNQLHHNLPRPHQASTPIFH